MVVWLHGAATIAGHLGDEPLVLPSGVLEEVRVQSDRDPHLTLTA